MDKGDSQNKIDMVFKAQRMPIQDDVRMTKVKYRTIMMVRWPPPLYSEIAPPSAQQPLWSIPSSFLSFVSKGLVTVFSALKRWCLVKSPSLGFFLWLPNALRGESWGWWKYKPTIVTS